MNKIDKIMSEYGPNHDLFRAAFIDSQPFYDDGRGQEDCGLSLLNAIAQLLIDVGDITEQTDFEIPICAAYNTLKLEAEKIGIKISK